MNRANAKKIANIITNQEIFEMFNKAIHNITSWHKISLVNKGMTKGTAWNILAKSFNISKDYSILAKTNMIREFGEFLPIHLRQQFQQQPKAIPKKIHHQKPDFGNYTERNKKP